MKTGTKTLLLVGALAGAAVLYSKYSAAQSSDNAEAGGSLGGQDTSLTNPDNPFSKIDPNYQYPTGPQYFIIGPDGSVTPTILPDQTVTDIPGNDGVPNNSDVSPQSVADPTNPPGMRWYENPFIQGAAFTAGAIGIGAGYEYVKGKITSPKAKELAVDAKIKGADTVTKEPIAEIREKMGFKSDNVKAEITRAQQFTDTTIKDPMKVSERVVAPKDVAIKTKFRTTTKIAEGAGTALLVLQGADTVVSTWNENRPQNFGEGVKTLYYDAPKKFGTGLFDFATGIIYRPKIDDEKKNTGFFATFQDFYDMGQQHRAENTVAATRITDVLGVSNLVAAMGVSSNKNVIVQSAINQPVQNSSLGNPITNPVVYAPATSSKKKSSGSSSKSVTQPSVSPANNYVNAATSAYGVSTAKTQTSTATKPVSQSVSYTKNVTASQYYSAKGTSSMFN